MNSGRTKIGKDKRTKGKTSKNSTKSKIAKVILLGTAPEAKPFLISEAKQAFTQLRQIFTKTPILHHFNPQCYIHIGTDLFRYAISGVLNQLILNQYFSRSDKNSFKSNNTG